jgi:hypothetical protein
MAKTATASKAPVSQEIIDACLARTVAEGDIVNFRFLFISYSPLRADSSEDIEASKYTYLRPANTDSAAYRAALALTQQGPIREHVRKQLNYKGPAQYPHELVLALGDNAVRLGKYTAAAQAYELLRIRRRMKDEFLTQGDAALDAGKTLPAVKAYTIATGLDYDYAAFPEPLPAAPNHQTRALMLHARYPQKPEEALALQPTDVHLKEALNYLLLDQESAARLLERPIEVQVEFITAWVRQQDPQWDAFAQRYREACGLVKTIGERLQRQANRAEGVSAIEEAIQAQQEAHDPRAVPAKLLGRAIENGEWWQYLKDLAYQHPASILFVSRQFVSRDLEIIMPRLQLGNPLIQRLGLNPE